MLLYSNRLNMSGVGVCYDDGDDVVNDDACGVILVIGASMIDRLVTVSSYPPADASIRSTSYSEQGGGNAANSASAMSKIANAKFFCGPSVAVGQSQQRRNKKIRVKLLSKVGDDDAAKSIEDELHAAGVDTASPLFRRGDPGTTTSFTTVIVDVSEQTRTCFHTPGTCGELSLADVESLSEEDIDGLFQNAIHLHSDSRHTDAALWMAREAKKRGITVSVDCERDRHTAALDELIELCDILLTNSGCLGGYLGRLASEKEEAAAAKKNGRGRPLPIPAVTINGEDVSEHNQHLADTYVRSLGPSDYFARWQEQKSAVGKEVVCTHGSMGSVHFRLIESSRGGGGPSAVKPHNRIDITIDEHSGIHTVRHSFSNEFESFLNLYEVHQTGILKDVTVVDTTGAGDAYIGGYVLTSTMAAYRGFHSEEPCIGTSSSSNGNSNNSSSSRNIQLAMDIGSFVGGQKVGGPGARTTLPTGQEFDTLLGSNEVDVMASLGNLIGSFNQYH